MARKRKTNDYSVELNLTPMIDCVFQLLIFFMVTTVFAVQSGLKVELPSAASSDAPPEKDLTIVISKNGEMDLNGRRVTFDNLQQEILKDKEIFGSKVLIIKADKKTLHGVVVKVMDIAKICGIDQLAIATEKEEESEK